MKENDPFAVSNDFYSIAVFGNMNPAIHHPAWYRSVELLSEEEVGLAEHSAPSHTEQASETQLVCTPQFSQFTAARLRIVCLPDHWTVLTLDKGQLPRIQQIASTVFERLGHTPVSSYSLNFAHHRDTELIDVGGHLAGILHSARLGLEEEKGTSASVYYSIASKDRELSISIEPSAKKRSMIYVGLNYSHPIHIEGFFDLGPMLRHSVERDYRDADSWLSRILISLKS